MRLGQMTKTALGTRLSCKIVTLQMLFPIADNCVTNSEAFTKAVVLSGHGSPVVWPVANETAIYCPSQ